jgi:hypothetical protein
MPKFLIFLGNFYKIFFNFLSLCLLPSLFAIIFLDISLRSLGYGYMWGWEVDKITRHPHPSDNFRGQPNVKDHNEYGFRGNFKSSNDSFNVAFFGGSTAYFGNPPIIEIVRNNLIQEGININVFNFGSVASNHSQHVRRLLDFSDKIKLDLVIFYGGGNETLQPVRYDPRPGYPYNFFFRNELSPFIQTMLKYSSILATIDIHTGGKISGLKIIRDSEFTPQWPDKIINNYWRDLSIANNLSQNLIQPNYCFQTKFVSILQPLKPSLKLEKDVWDKLVESSKLFDRKWTHLDLSMINDIEFNDIFHVNQISKERIASNISPIVKEFFQKECKKK